jgi:RNA polymerase sigma-70 factor (ECF subfamily)
MHNDMHYELLADEVLLRLLKQSDEKAFTAIFNRYWEKIFLSAYKKLRSKQIAEDLTQNLFAVLWDNRDRYQIDHLFKYLSVGMKNRVINYIDAEIAKSNQRPAVYAVSNEANSADQKVVLHDLQAAINKALAHLPEKTRTIFKMSRFENYPVKEIAKQLGLTEKAVEYHITQSNKILSLHLKEFLVFSLILIETNCLA